MFKTLSKPIRNDLNFKDFIVILVIVMVDVMRFAIYRKLKPKAKASKGASSRCVL